MNPVGDSDLDPDSNKPVDSAINTETEESLEAVWT